MTVWTAATAVTDFRYDQTVWVLQLRASKDLASVFSYAADDEMGEALQTSKRKFEVVLDGGVMGYMARGQRLSKERRRWSPRRRCGPRAPGAAVPYRRGCAPGLRP